ncbi:hypothetical protein VPHK469_0163 [Vibrio phage K469]
MQIKIDTLGIISAIVHGEAIVIGQLAKVGRDHIFSPNEEGRKMFGLTGKMFGPSDNLNVHVRCLTFIQTFELRANSHTFKGDDGWVTKMKFICPARKIDKDVEHKWGALEPTRAQITNLMKDVRSTHDISSINTNIKD